MIWHLACLEPTVWESCALATYLSLLRTSFERWGMAERKGGTTTLNWQLNWCRAKRRCFLAVLFDQLYVFNTWFVWQLAPTNYLMLPGIFVLHALLGPVHPHTIKPFLCHPFYPDVIHYVSLCTRLSLLFRTANDERLHGWGPGSEANLEMDHFSCRTLGHATSHFSSSKFQ